MHQKLSLGIIIGISIVAVNSWVFLIVPDLKNDPYGLEQFFELDGTNNIASSIGGELEKLKTKDTFGLEIVSVKGNIVNLEGTFHVYDIIAEQQVYSNTIQYSINKNNKIIQDKNILLKFPNDVEKRNYILYHPIVEQIGEFTFEKVENVNGLEMYVYSCEALNLDSTGTMPQFEGYTITTDQWCKIWIEPKTGYEVDFNLIYKSYVIDDGKRVQTAEGGSKITEYSKKVNFQIAKEKKNLFYIYDTVIPILLIVISAGSTLVVVVYQNLRTRTDELTKAENEKMIILGKFTSRLAHDLRNPLSIIMVSLENLKALYGTDDTKQSHYDRVERSIDRMVHQLDNVLDFVKDQPVELNRAKFSEIMKESRDSLVIPDNIKLILPKNDVELFSDVKQFSIAMNNLILNAVQAIEGEGTVEITVEENNDEIVIQVKDSGKPIPKEELDIIFDPLFTTKQYGTGLGLSSVKSIIKAHDGIISVTSPPVIFTIRLPKISD